MLRNGDLWWKMGEGHIMQYIWSSLPPPPTGVEGGGAGKQQASAHFKF